MSMILTIIVTLAMMIKIIDTIVANVAMRSARKTSNLARSDKVMEDERIRHMKMCTTSQGNLI